MEHEIHHDVAKRLFTVKLPQGNAKDRRAVKDALVALNPDWVDGVNLKGAGTSVRIYYMEGTQTDKVEKQLARLVNEIESSEHEQVTPEPIPGNKSVKNSSSSEDGGKGPDPIPWNESKEKSGMVPMSSAPVDVLGALADLANKTGQRITLTIEPRQ